MELGSSQIHAKCQANEVISCMREQDVSRGSERTYFGAQYPLLRETNDICIPLAII